MSRPAKETALKPCPYCGGERIEIHEVASHGGSGVGFEAYCMTCYENDSDVGQYGLTREHAIEKWNRRAS